MTTPTGINKAPAGWMPHPPGRGVGRAPSRWMPTSIPSANTESALQAQVNRASDLVKRANEALSKLKKPTGDNKAAMKAYELQLKNYKKQLDMAKAQLNTANKALNGYYSNTGQYEKLLKGENRDAFLAINAVFKEYGLQSLAGKIYDYVKNGYSADTISILLQDTPEYKQRFAGNEARKAAGLPVLSPAEYLATESSYRQIMQSAGLPSGFYDQHSDFVNWIGQNVSPSEIQGRVDLATQATVLANPDYRKALNQMGISDKEMTAYFLDQKKALPILQRSAATAQVGAAALSQGLTFDQAYSEKLAESGISADSARQGYSQVASELGTMQNLAGIYGGDWTQRTSEEAIFQGTAEATQKKARLLSQERGAFSGQAGSARGGLGQAGGAR